MRVAHDGVYGVVLMQVLHLQDAFLWLVCYYAATVLLLVTVLTLLIPKLPPVGTLDLCRCESPQRWECGHAADEAALPTG